MKIIRNIVQGVNRSFAKNGLGVFKAPLLIVAAAAFIASGFFVSASTANAVVNQITLTSPTGGENWSGTKNITWTYLNGSGSVGPISILLSTNDGSYNQLVTGVDVASTTYQWDTTSVNDGTTYKIEVLDVATGLNDASPSYFTVDNTAPTLIINDGTEGGPVQTDTIKITTDDVPSGVASQEYGFSADATCDSSDTYGNSFDSGVDFPIAGDHIDYLCAEATDNAGNVGYKLVGQLNTDNTAPIMDSITPDNGSYLSGTQTFVFDFSDTNLAYLEFDFAPEPYSQATKEGITLLASSDMGLTSDELAALNSIGISPSYTNNVGWTISIDTTATLPLGFVGQMFLWVTSADQPIWPDGLFDFYVEVGDSAGNQWGDMNDSPEWGGLKLYKYTFDNTSPTLTIIDGTETGPVQTDTINITTDDATSGVASQEYGFSADATCDSSDTYGHSFASDTNFPIAGDHIDYLCAEATDNAGNVGYKLVGQLNTDNTAPAIPDITGITTDTGRSNSDNITNDNTLRFNGTASSDTANIEVFVNGISIGIIATSTPWSFDYTGTTLSDDAYTAYAKASDAAGNTSSKSADFNFIVDTSTPDAPTITQIGDVGNYINIANKNAVTVTGTAEADSVVSVTLGDGTATTSPATVTTDSNGGYTANIDASSLADGAITANANATDAAGNTSPDAIGVATKDTVTPTVESITTKDNNTNGKIDTAIIVFDEPMDLSSLTASDFTIDSKSVESIAASSTNPNVFIFTLANLNEADGTDAKTVAYTGSDATDIAGNPLADFSQASTDKAGPVMMSAVTISTTEIKVTFSEDIEGNTVNSSGNEFTVAGYDVSAATESASGVINLTVATMSTDATPDVVFTNAGTFTDLAGNEAITPITVLATDGVAPVLTSVVIASNNASTTLAKVGNTVTLSFTSSEEITEPTVTIDEQSSAIVAGGPVNWTATYVFAGSEPEGTIPFTIDFADDATPTPNAGEQVTATTDETSVFYDETVPSVNAGSDKEVNALVTQDATVSDGGSGIATYAWTNETPSVGTITFGTPNAEDTTISADADGTYTLRLTVTDNAGNIAYDEITFIWDTTAPQVEWTSPYTNASGVATSTGTAKIGFYGGSGNIVLLDSSKVTLKDTNTNALYSTAVSVEGGDGNSTTLNIDYSALNPNTTYRINMQAGAVRDVAGNVFAGNLQSYFTTAETPAEVDTEAPDAPVITTTADTVDANFYTISGTVADDGGQRIVNLYNGSTLAGTAVLATGDTDWTINVSLAQNASNVFTATATDGVGNESGASNSVTITEADSAIVIPTISLLGDPIASPYTVDEATSRFGTNGLQFTTTDAVSATVNGVSVSITSNTITAASAVDATTLGLHLYTIIVTSSTGNTATKIVGYQVNANPAGDEIPPVITLLGQNPLTLTVGDTYTDPGATASDNVDGDISLHIAVSGDTVDTSTAGVYVVKYDVSDAAGNPAAEEIRTVIVVNPAITPVIPTIALYGDAIIPTYTLSEAQARFADGLQFTMTGASSVTVNGATAAITGGATAATTTISESDATTLGLHVYNVVVTSSTGDIAGTTIAYNVGADFADFDDSASLGVTSIVASSTMATADNTFENGWSWVFNITAPTNETQFKMMFSDFISGANSIAAADNIRFYSAQSSDSYSTSTATTITAANAYSDAITLDTDLEPATPGRQIKVIVEMKVPTGSAGGSYSASYGVSSN